jgi:signal transduction histidine kinase/ligand-binding sensor domain-containing protein
VHRSAIAGAVFGALAVAACAPRARAQVTFLPVDQFTIDDGLAQNFVTSVAQDRAGFVWVGTARGLQRFDGYSFLAYRSLDAASPAELSDRIISLKLDGYGNLWIATERALFRRSARSQRLARIAVDSGPRTWGVDSIGALWLIESDMLKRVDYSAESPRAVTVMADSALLECFGLTTTRGGDLWVGCRREGGAVARRINPRTRQMRTIPFVALTVPEDGAEDADGRIWFAGNGGVEIIDTTRAVSRAVGAFRGVITGDVQAERDSGVIVLTEAPGFGGGVARVDRAGRVVQQWTSREVFAEAPLAQDFMIDRDGGFWIATATAGLLRLDPTRPTFDHVSSRSNPPFPFTSDFIMALHETPDGSLWVGTLRGGAYRVSSDWNRVDAVRHDPKRGTGLPSLEVWDFEEDRAGHLWIATTTGVCMATLSTFRCHRPPDGDTTASHLVLDGDGWFWLARTKSVVSFDPATGAFGPVIYRGTPMTLYVDRDSAYLWMAAERLARVRIAQGRAVGLVEEVPAAVTGNSSIFAFHRDQEGALWLASELGLQRWDVANRRFVPVAVRELQGTTVYSIVEDRQGRFWLGTGHGIVQYSPSTGISRRYRRQDGVRNNEFNRRAALLRHDGELVFGGVEGITRFRPDVVTRRRAAPPLIFTRWRRVTSSGTTEATLDTLSEVRVRSGDRGIAIEFAALTFAAGPARQYRYRLAGLNDDWTESSSNTVTYASLPPGHYRLIVQAAAGSAGTWHEPGVSLRMIVVPPLWRTTWFRAVAVLLVATGVWMLHRLRLRQALASERLRLRISRDLHDEIGAGLSSIALLSDSVGGNGAITERDRQQLGRIARSARQMVDDLRDIVWAIDPDADRLEHTVSRMRDVADTLLPHARVNFRVASPAELSETVDMVARRELLLIYKEILHNVARHARASAVDIRLEAQRGALTLVVADDGCGFEPDRARGGTGLKSMRERAARLGGRVDLTSGAATGTTVTLTVRRT